MKFNEYQYLRPNMQEVEKKFLAALEVVQNSHDLDEVSAVFEAINKVRDSVSTMESLVYVRHSINTTDEFYEKEQAFFDENLPVYAGYVNQLAKVLVTCPLTKELEQKYGKRFFDSVRISLKTFTPEIVEDLQAENKLVTKYDKLIASAKIEFAGKINNLPQMTPYMSSPERTVRKDAEAAVFNFFSENSQEFDNIYDSLVKLRDMIAKKLGFENYVPLGYARLGRGDYDAKMVANYRKQVYEDLVPIAQEIIAAKKKRLNIAELKSYDLSLNFISGNPKPKGDRQWQVEQARKMYHEMSKETGEFIDFMVDRELMDLDAKPGKRGGGYCTYFSDYKSPFIFANFNGTSGDVDVLTHEAGHAFQVYSSRDFIIPEYKWPTLEACEIHSMSMEFFAWPWIDYFFKEDTDKYKYSHLASSITFIPYGVTVDEFQHAVYENPSWTPKERKAAWRAIEKKYMPYKVYENKFADEGNYWLRQGHIFQSPFYYIDYTLAQVCAHQFWIKNRENHEKAWSDYYRLCCAGGSKSFTELLDVAKLDNPFVDGTIKKTVKELKKWLDDFDDTKLS
ncbi:MAG TPA: M3 family oligoendopeptidase [Bacilli bacterium]|nr:M3 family oligoendopeptidase [Bacilli bacterium]